MIVPLFVLVTLASASSLPRAAVLVRATGFAEADTAKLEDKVSAEVAARGFEVVRVNEGDPACLSTRACARDLVRNAGAVSLARIDLVRGGGNVQIAAVLFDDEGRASEEVNGLARLTSLLGGDAVLPPAFLPLLAATKPAADTQPPPSTAVQGVPPTTTQPVITPPTAEPSTSPEPDPSEAKPLSGVALAAIGGVAVGALGIAVGVVGATGQVGVARDPAALGTDKERAAVLLPVLVTVAVVGVALAGASGWVLVSELD